MAKPRVIISSDIGGSDPDDMESMAHALLASDQWNLQALISTPTGHGGRASDIHVAIDAYARDYANLETWSSGYKSPDDLRSIVYQGSLDVQPGPGYSSATAASQAIIRAAHEAANAGEPLWIMTWGALTDVAQALHDDPSIMPHVRVLASNGWNWKQDPNAYDYVLDQAAKGLWMIDSKSTHRGIYVDGTGAENNSFDLMEAKGHGALGSYFYWARPWGVKMGDSWSIAYLTDQAANGDPTADSHGGTFVKNGTGPNYWTDDPDPSVAIADYAGARHVREHQSEIYEDMYRLFDRADAANPNPVDDGDQLTPPADDTPTSGGSGNPVTAVDDHYEVNAGEKLYQNSRYFTWNDKGGDGGLKVTQVDATSANGVSVNWWDNGTMVYRAPGSFDGVDTIGYTVVDADGSSARGTVVITVNGPTVSEPAPEPIFESDPVVAKDDPWYQVDAGEKLWVNARYFAMNDTGGDGKLKVVAVDTTSEHGGRITFNQDNGTVTYKAATGFSGRDSFDYTVADAAGHTDVGTVIVQVADLVA